MTTLVTYSGPWTSFTTPQSLIQNNVTMTLNPAGVNQLLSLVQNQQNVVHLPRWIVLAGDQCGEFD